ncbi:MAG TPA: hypothetical protein DHW63_11855 [Hyphomonadaceae bacterium]|nr:hypothetical protein [Hyphomonadaceae bacterium]
MDNFEAIAAIAMPDGATRVYILSDDNFSHRQRTLLLAFDLPAREADFSERTARFERAPEDRVSRVPASSGGR